jgi:hypothetical protein
VDGDTVTGDTQSLLVGNLYPSHDWARRHNRALRSAGD